MLKQNNNNYCLRKKRSVTCLAAGAMALALMIPAAAKESDTELTAATYQQTLETLTAHPRWAGTAEAQETADMITAQMQDYGLEVQQQTFQFTQEAVGKQSTNEAVNVIAVKPAAADQATGDILIVSAHYDSMACTTGANDNASGQALLLELARVLQNTATDTEIRFISFSAEEEGLIGSTAYVNSLTQEEKDHIIGDIQIDMIGHYKSTGSQIGTISSEETLLVQMLKEASKEVTGTEWNTACITASDHASFAFAGIPAVLIEQESAGFTENHRFIDQTALIDPKQAVETGKVIEAVIRSIASEESGSLAESARETSVQNAVAIQENTPVLFGAGKSDVSVKLGASGLFQKDILSEFGYEQSYYLINASWFGWEPLPTELVYRKDTLTLDRVLIQTDSLSLSEDELSEKLTETLGEPVVQEDGTAIWGSSSMAENPSLRQYIITEEDGAQMIEVLSYMHLNTGEDIMVYPLQDADESMEGDAADQAVLAAVRKVIPEQDPYVKQVISWTDGYSYVLGSCTADDLTKSDSFSIRIDKNDFFNHDGTMISESKFLATAVHEYGHALTLNESQMNVLLLTETANYNDITLYQENSYMKAFYDKFYADGKQRDFYEYPEDFVNEYAGTSGIFEDIAESFMQFVFSEKQEDDSLAAQKINFFYDYSELVTARDYIRQNFDY